jgi:hypothetical protein
MNRDDLPLNAKVGGLLLDAFREGTTEEIDWSDVRVDDIIVTAACDAMKARINGVLGVRLPVTYEEAVTICAELDCVSPTQRMCDAMYTQAKAQLSAIPLVMSSADAAKMTTVEFVMKFHERAQKALSSRTCARGELIFGAWKLWILHPRIVERGAINYGFWDGSHKPPRVIQSVGAQHDARHYDYSQLLVPVKRMARDARTGEPVDLLEWMKVHEKIPERYLEPYRVKLPKPPPFESLPIA